MPRRLKVTDVNAHVTCPICDGYLVDATAIIECLHAFCRTCIVRYLEKSRFCPVCDVQVHETKPLLSIRSDQTLQDLVYKIVPELFQNEMQKRRTFYAQHPEAIAGSQPEERGEVEPRFFSPKETISLTIHHRPKETRLEEPSEDMDPTTRYLNCPAAFTIGHLKKFIRLKFSLAATYAVDIFYDEQVVKDSYSLMDVAYIYSWKRAEPMKFFYSISKLSPKCIEQTAAKPEMEVDSLKGGSEVVEDAPEALKAPVVTEVEEMQVDAEPNDKNIEKDVPSLPRPLLLPPPPSREETKVSVEMEDIPCSKEVRAPPQTLLQPTSSGGTQPRPKLQELQTSTTPLETTPQISLPSEKAQAPLPLEKIQISTSLESTQSRTLQDAQASVSVEKMETSTSLGSTQASASSERVQSVIPLAEKQTPPSKEVKAVSSEKVTVTMSSTDDIQPMDVTEPEIVKPTNSSLTLAVLPPIPEPTYNSVKLVSTPERETMLSPTNGFKLKFIHDPELSPKSRSKKGRKGGRSSRCKSTPVRLARLAPYPPPPPPPQPPTIPVTCLATQPLQHLPQLVGRKLVPSVITTLAPTFVTTLVSTTSNTLCNVRNNSGVPQVSSFLSPPSVTVSNISTHSNGVVVPSFPSSSAENCNTLSSISQSDAASKSMDASQDTRANTKELPSTKTTPESTTISPSGVPVSTISIAVNSMLTVCNSSSVSDKPKIPPPTSLEKEISNTSLKNSSDLLTNTHSSDNSLSNNHSPPVSSACSKDCSETVSSTSPKVTHSVRTVPTTVTDCDSQTKKNPSCEPMVNGKEKDRSILSDRESESFKISVKNSISAEFSDNDDLGCQPDLVVDEQKMDSSDNDDDADAALRKKINAIAEKEDEADGTDDTEADSGRASDLSCPSMCSPATTETMVSSSAPIHSVAVATVTSSAPLPDLHRNAKSNNIDHVIKQLYLQHEMSRPLPSPKPVTSSSHPQTLARIASPNPLQTSAPLPIPLPNPPKTPAPPKNDDMGVLDLSTCTRKSSPIRFRAVANPVHRQKPYLPAPVTKQHTACPPAPTPPPPKTPTPSLLMTQLTATHPTPPIRTPSPGSSILQAQLTGNPKPSNHSLPYTSPSVLPSYSLPVNRTVSPVSSLPVRPSFSYRFPQNQTPQSIYSSMFPYSMMDMTSFAPRNSLVPGIPPLAARSSPLSREVSSPANSKMHVFSKQNSSSSSRRLSDTFVSSAPSPTSARRLLDTFASSTPPPGHCRVPTVPSPNSAPAHPRASPSVLPRMSPLHRSASPAPSPQSVSLMNNNSAASAVVPPTSTSSQNKPSVPIYKKSESSHKGFRVKRNSNLAVFNSDPNGYVPKLVIKNLDSKSFNHHHHHKSKHH